MCRRRWGRTLRTRMDLAEPAVRVTVREPWRDLPCRGEPLRSNIFEPDLRRGSVAASRYQARLATHNCRSERIPMGTEVSKWLNHRPREQVVRIDKIEVLIVIPADLGVLAIELSGKQRHALVLRGGSPQGRHTE